MKKKVLYINIAYLILFGILIFVDQYCKYLADIHLKYSSKKTIIKDILSFEYLENSGAAWGILSGKIGLFALLTVIVILLLLFILYRVNKYMITTNILLPRFIILQITVVLLISGAIGNFIDRIRLNYVIDFIKTDFISFPTFNIADCYVTISAIILIFMLLFKLSEDDINKILGK